MKFKQNENETKVYKTLPKGWRVTEGTLTQPVGTVWIDNGKSVFAKGKDGKRLRKQALMVENEALLIVRAAENKIYEKHKGEFVGDKKIEAKIEKEVKRQRAARAAWEKERAQRTKANQKSKAKKRGKRG